MNIGSWRDAYNTFSGIHNPKGIPGSFNGAHQIELEFAFVALDLVALQLSQAMFRADAAIHAMHQIVDDFVDALGLCEEIRIALRRSASDRWTTSGFVSLRFAIFSFVGGSLLPNDRLHKTIYPLGVAKRLAPTNGEWELRSCETFWSA